MSFTPRPEFLRDADKYDLLWLTRDGRDEGRKPTLTIKSADGYLTLTRHCDIVGDKSVGLYFAEAMGLLDCLLLMKHEARVRSAEWTLEMEKGLTSEVRYPEWRLRSIVDGNPLDWDDNVDPRAATKELRRRELTIYV